MFDAPTRLCRRANEIDTGQTSQRCRFGAFGEVDRAVRENGVGAAGLTVDLHAVFEIFHAAESPRWGPALCFLGRIGDPPRTAPGADQEGWAAFAPRPGR